MSAVQTVLVISPTPSSPAIQGNRQRVRDFGRALKAAGMRVIFIYYATEGLSEASLVGMQAEWDHLIVVRPGANHQKRSFAAFYGIDDWCPPELVEAVADVFRHVKIDLCVVNYVWLSACLEVVPAGCTKIIDTHDLFGGRADHFYALKRQPEWFYTSPDQEMIGLDRADYVVAIQDEEAEVLRTRTQARVLSIGMLAGEIPHRNVRQHDGRTVVGFIASGNPMNVHSILSYIEALRTLPEMSTVEHVAAGSICDILSQLPAQPFRLLGLTDTVAAFYEQIDIAINPMIGGTGLKIKSIEALTHGVAFVGTKDAMAGIPSDRPEHRYDTALEVARGVYHLASEPRALNASAESSTPLFRSYAWEQYARFTAFLERLFGTLETLPDTEKPA